MRMQKTCPGGAFTGSKPRRLRAFRSALAAVGLAFSFAASAIPAMAQDLQPGTLRMGQSATRPGTLVLSWQGPIAAPMANQIRDAFESQKRQSSSISFRISSQGGSVSEGERVIEVLRKIRETHELETTVSHGDVCASMCVFIYLQGKKRSGALTSSWLFHEVSHIDPVTKQTTRIDRAAWERLVDKYFRSAGVSEPWIADLKPRTVQSDYWQTGGDLVQAKSGIILEPLGNQKARLIVASPAAGRQAYGRQEGRPGPCRRPRWRVQEILRHRGRRADRALLLSPPGTTRPGSAGRRRQDSPPSDPQPASA